MRSVKAWWKGLLISAFALFLGLNIVEAALAGPPSRPRDADREQARRELPTASGSDPRTFSPPGDWIGGNGVVEPRDRETHVASEVAGRVSEIRAREGARVSAGDVLLELEHQVQDSELAAAEAERQATEADFTRIARGNRAEDVQAVVAEADAAAARAASAESVAARLSNVERAGGATPDEADRARRQAEADRAAASAADARRRAAIAGSRREDIVAARARVVAATGRRDRAAAERSLRVVTAPLAGEVFQIKVRPGEYYQPGGGALVVIGDTSQVRARIDVDERDVGRVRDAARAIIRTAAYPGVDFGGQVVEIARRMGRKNVRSDDPVERNDTKILEVVVRLDDAKQLFFGQRVMGYLAAQGEREASVKSAKPEPSH